MRPEKLLRLWKIAAALLCLLVAGAPALRAQCYVFTSRTAGIEVTAYITITAKRVIEPTPGQTRIISFDYTGTYSETVNGVTISSSGPAAKAQIGYEGVPGTVPWTTLVMGSTNAPGTNNGVYWAVNLNGTGDLLPNGLTPVLPPLSAWQYTPAGGTAPGNHLRIFANGVTVKQDYDVIVDGIGSCGVPNAKLLGEAASVPGCLICGDPINVATGNLYEQVTDYETVGSNPLGFIRYYNSQSPTNTLATTLGTGWRSNYDRYLHLISPTSVTAERGDGQQLTFTLTSGSWTTDTDVDYKLTNSGSTWTLTDSKDTVETYTNSGASQALLQSSRTRNGYTQTLLYAGSQLTTVTDSFRRQLSFTYSGGKLQSVTTPDGVVLNYGYTGGQLTSISYPTAPVTSQVYLYENDKLPAALTGIVDENGNRYSTYTYDGNGRALSSQHAGGADFTSVAYNDTDGSRTITNALGAKSVARFSTLQNVPKMTQIDRQATATTPAGTMKFTYDKNGYLASQTDWNGNVTNYTNDAMGRPVTVVEAAGTPQARTTTTTYHATFHLPVRMVEPGLTTTFTYDSNGELLTKTQADATTTTAPYATSGQARTWTFTWTNFTLASVKGPRPDATGLTRFTYDSSGALTGSTNPLGETTQITQHLPGGLPQTIVDANGVTTQVTYDARLRMLARTINTTAGPLTTSYSYDPAGNLLSVTEPDGSALTNSYDAAHRVTGITDLLGQQVVYTLDVAGGRTQTSILDAGGTQQRAGTQTFDALGRLLRKTGGSAQRTSYAYDSNGNAVTITDPLNHVRQQSFDGLNRAVRETDAAKGIATTSYDSHDRPVSVTDANGAVTTYVYDGFGEVIQKVSPDSGTTVYRYDLNGNLTQRIDGSGAIANYAYDALDRMTSASYPGNTAENATYTYDQSAAGFGIGRLTSVSDAAGVLNRSYDERGNILIENRTIGSATLVTAYAYDAAGRVASIKYPSGWTISFVRDTIGRITAVTAQTPDGSGSFPIVSGVNYQPFGPVNTVNFGNGVAETRTFDLDYRTTSLTDTGANPVQSLSYTYDGDDNVQSIADGVTAANSQSFAYDVLNRITSASGSYGSLSYSYDAVGNRMSQSGGGSASAYAYTSHSNRVTSVSAAGTTQTIGYTKAGLVNSFNPAAGAITDLLYNQAGHLATVMAAGNPVARYTYDGLGQRLARTGAVTATTLYQYDTGGHLIEETDDQGVPLVDYIYLDDRPVATISPVTGQIYFLHDDRLGTPQVATDAGQNPVWVAAYGPFGEMSTVPSGIVQDLRLPGQEFDAETGLYHNGFRDYVPGWGRYLQSDPIGLAAGFNSYAYVGGNPLRGIDRWGLGNQSADPLKGPSEVTDAIEWYQKLTVSEIEGGPEAILVVNTAKVAYGIWKLYNDLKGDDVVIPDLSHLPCPKSGNLNAPVPRDLLDDLNGFHPDAAWLKANPWFHPVIYVTPAVGPNVAADGIAYY